MADDKNQKVVNFESLELEEEETAGPSKMETLLSFVKEKLSEDDYSSLQKELGIEGKDMSNEELFEQIKALFKGAKPEEKEEEPEDEETEMMDQQTFMEECLTSGKDREACLEEWKKKNPEEPPKEEGKGEPDELANKVSELQRQLSELKKDKDLGEVTTSVEKLIEDRHLAPIQKEMAIKLASGLDATGRKEMYNFWKKTQKFTVSEDVGSMASSRPGMPGAITPERRAELLKTSGLGDLIKDKADQTKLPWKLEDN